MKAIIKTGGKQYTVEKDTEIYVEKLVGEPGDSVTFDEVLMLGDEVGTPYISGATVTGEIVKHGKGKKLTIFKYRPKKDSKSKTGHRQPYTLVKITKVGK